MIPPDADQNADIAHRTFRTNLTFGSTLQPFSTSALPQIHLSIVLQVLVSPKRESEQLEAV